VIREGLRLGVIVALVAWVARDLPWLAHLFVAGVVPGLWWSTAAWEADDVDPRAALVVCALAGAFVLIVPGVPGDPWLVAATFLGTQLARLRLVPSRVDTVDPETWARRNAHLYRAGRPDMPVPDLSSSDPYVLITGAGRGRQPPPDPYAAVPDEHHRFLGREP
jgi:hypothetical protein